MNNGCINDFGLQAFYKLQFVDFMRFVSLYNNNFVASTFSTTTSNNKFGDGWEIGKPTLRYVLKIIYLESISSQDISYLSIPMRDYIEALDSIVKEETSKKMLRKTADKVKHLDPWKKMVERLEEWCIHSYSIETFYKFLALRPLIFSKLKAVDLMKNSITSEIPDLTEMYEIYH